VAFFGFGTVEAALVVTPADFELLLHAAATSVAAINPRSARFTPLPRAG
jgi:hypothetical protein